MTGERVSVLDAEQRMDEAAAGLSVQSSSHIKHQTFNLRG
jgi:hypothetical protein